MAIPQTVKNDIIFRARNCCEYCKSQDKFSPIFFSIDHIRPIKEGGTDNIENLAYACMLCNRLKWDKMVGLDLVSNKIAPLFNPRVNSWDDHFSWDDEYVLVIGLTSTGRATVETLQLNRPKLIEYRKLLFGLGMHPPT